MAKIKPSKPTPTPAIDLLKVEYIPTAELIPYARNSKTHSAEQVALIAASIREFKVMRPVLIDETKTIIAGHGLVLALQKLGVAQCPVIMHRHLTDAQKRAYVIADNKLAERSEWNADMLKLEVVDLNLSGFDVGLLGFNDKELAALLNKPADGLTDPDADAPPPPLTPVSKPGDIWVLGKHRLMCGDSTDADAVKALLNGVVPLLMVTDPPYGVDYDSPWRNEKLRANGKPIGGRAVGKVANDDNADWTKAWAAFPGDIAYVWHSGYFSHLVADSLLASGFKIRAQIIWNKSNFAIGRGDYHWKHESCWYVVRNGKTGHWAGDRKQTTVWEIQKPAKSETGHSTQKPVECMQRPIENNSNPGQAVYDPFMGSGTTIIAAERSGRVALGMELEPGYVDVAVARWEAFTGQKATHAETGAPFPGIGVAADVAPMPVAEKKKARARKSA